MTGLKRTLEEASNDGEDLVKPASPTTSASAASSFRNVSACNRSVSRPG
jgi:hypothetical protein